MILTSIRVQASLDPLLLQLVEIVRLGDSILLLLSFLFQLLLSRFPFLPSFFG